MPDKNLAKTETEPETSEYGSGFLYPLALFVAHSMELNRLLRWFASPEKANQIEQHSPDHAAQVAIYGAADHMSEFDPDLAPEPLKERCRALRSTALAWQYPDEDNKPHATVDGVHKLFDEAKRIFLAIDRLNGVEAIESGCT